MLIQDLRGFQTWAQRLLCRFVMAAFVPLIAAAVEAEQPTPAETLWKKLEPFAQPPEEFAGKFGTYRSPLKFADGSVVKTAADWLFDEPTSALDPEMIKEVLDVMTELAKGGITMICVTHEMGFARTVADNILFMDMGEIVEQGPPATFFSNPKTDRLKLFLSQILGH